MDKYRGKYRIPSARWAAWDYAGNAAYFITLCTAHREHCFGVIANGAMTLTPLGQAAVDCWHEIPAHFPFVVLDEFGVMPNHVHGIVVINKPTTGGVGMQNVVETQHVVETQNFASLRNASNRFGPQSQNLASIVRGYKIGVTKCARQNNFPFAWQDRYHDHVIRDEGEYHRIRQYICENPQRWTDDALFTAEN
jgi:REP element-mobilizing transposase RayT